MSAGAGGAGRRGFGPTAATIGGAVAQSPRAPRAAGRATGARAARRATGARARAHHFFGGPINAISGSDFIFAIRLMAVFRSNFRGESFGVSSFHSSGIEAVPIGVGRST
jgi:hypothetical protein